MPLKRVVGFHAEEPSAGSGIASQKTDVVWQQFGNSRVARMRPTRCRNPAKRDFRNAGGPMFSGADRLGTVGANAMNSGDSGINHRLVLNDD